MKTQAQQRDFARAMINKASGRISSAQWHFAASPAGPESIALARCIEALGDLAEAVAVLDERLSALEATAAPPQE